jgi:hypothetical protein
MKNIWLLGLLALALAASATASVSPSATTSEIPNLVGLWSGIGTGYGDEQGYVSDEDSDIITMNVTEQRGRIFNGMMTYVEEGVEIVEEFAGAIALDNVTFYIAEFGSGYDVGTIISEDEIELLYLQDGEGGGVYIDSLRRVGE